LKPSPPPSPARGPRWPRRRSRLWSASGSARSRISPWPSCRRDSAGASRSGSC
jgi:hypothetical protein